LVPVQLGRLDAANSSKTGVESAWQAMEPTVLSNTLLKRAERRREVGEEITRGDSTVIPSE
jgi:hypothetical protein